MVFSQVRGVAHRHIPTGKVSKACAGSLVIRVQRSVLACHLAPRVISGSVFFRDSPSVIGLRVSRPGGAFTVGGGDSRPTFQSGLAKRYFLPERLAGRLAPSVTP
jgi:hypothetical protein